jgi:hypothetical protein
MPVQVMGPPVQSSSRRKSDGAIGLMSTQTTTNVNRNQVGDEEEDDDDDDEYDD